MWTYFKTTICRFNFFKSDIGSRRQCESCGIWLEFSRFRIDAQYLLGINSESTEFQQVWRELHQVLHFMHSILQVYPRKMLYLSFPIESVGHCIRHANIKILSEPDLSVYGQNLMTYAGKHVSKNTLTYTCFTQCDVFKL